MRAEIYCIELPTDKYSAIVNQESLIEFLRSSKIVYGIHDHVIQSIADQKVKKEDFPIIIAEGHYPTNGEDGKIVYHFKKKLDIDRDSNWHFRDVMRIPSVKEGDQLATVIPPTSGEDGSDIFGNVIKAKRGREKKLRAGSNVEFQEKDQTYYATADGQVVIRRNQIIVDPVYEIYDDLSMKTGNLDFVGTVIIRGNVPSGYTVKAEGDVRIYGLVEAATVIAGGSVYITEGLAGLKKGRVEADESVYISYVNQGIIHAKDSIYVENSIVHSDLHAEKNILCKNGSIIGGKVQAGEVIQAHSIGNRVYTKTFVVLGNHNFDDREEKKLLREKKQLEKTLEKLNLIGKKLNVATQDPQLKRMLVRQQRSKMKVIQKLNDLKMRLEKIEKQSQSDKEMSINIQNIIYPNVVIMYNKYEETIQRIHRHVKIKIDQNELVIQGLDES